MEFSNVSKFGEKIGTIQHGVPSDDSAEAYNRYAAGRDEIPKIMDTVLAPLGKRAILRGKGDVHVFPPPVDRNEIAGIGNLLANAFKDLDSRLNHPTYPAGELPAFTPAITPTTNAIETVQLLDS